MNWRHRLSAPLRRLRWTIGRWSTESDRTFHDHLFTARYNPFTPSYPGYLTIRRFADLAEERIAGARSVLDLGCGPGEITCELARRLPGTTFVGMDHSAIAIARAREHVARLQLGNVTFMTANLETFTPSSAVDAILMFDAFHHLLDPDAFITRSRNRTGRFVLIEPAGTWAGGWNRRFDLDWLSLSMSRVRDRLEQQLAVRPLLAGTTAAAPRQHEDEPTERRYASGDFVRMFAPWPVEIVGTVAGLQQYGPSPFATSEVRDRIGDATYRLIVDVETLLRTTGRDLWAKHWVIHAAPDVAPRHAVPAVSGHVQDEIPVQGAHDARYANYEGPSVALAHDVFLATIEVTNLGWKSWTSAGATPAYVSYRWQDRRGRTLVSDGMRSPFPGTMAPGSQRVIPLRVQAPPAAGKYDLVIDIVEEGVTWFSEVGVAPLRVRFRIE